MTRHLVLLGLAAVMAGAETLPVGPAKTIRTNCLGCHSGAVKKGGVDLERAAIDWTVAGERTLWERALLAVEQKRMPPAPMQRLAAADAAGLT